MNMLHDLAYFVQIKFLIFFMIFMKIGAGIPHPWVFLISLMCKETKVRRHFLCILEGGSALNTDILL
jgi:hypothetical protein